MWIIKVMPVEISPMEFVTALLLDEKLRLIHMKRVCVAILLIQRMQLAQHHFLAQALSLQAQ
jgi:hypothetical protein